MDIEKITIRGHITRLIRNYYLLGKLSQETTDKITDFINREIGGGELEKKEDGRIIVFPNKRETKPGPYFIPDPLTGDDIIKVLKAAGVHSWAVKKGLYNMGIKTLADCHNLTLEKIRDIRGVGELRAKAIYDSLKAAYEAESYAKEKRE